VLCHVSRSCVQILLLEGVGSTLKAFQKSKVASTVQSMHSCVLSVHQCKGGRWWIGFVVFPVPCTCLLQTQCEPGITVCDNPFGKSKQRYKVFQILKGYTCSVNCFHAWDEFSCFGTSLIQNHENGIKTL